ncbi:MAG TPA: hypothetical protein VNS58_02370 [Puia sp.]|nr:hypothetical protein [Puia sp.]
MKKNRLGFISICKINYFDKITPSNKNVSNLEGYLKLVEIAKSYFDNNELDDFTGYFQDGQYFINLWAAHLVIEYGNPSIFWRDKALEIIIRYSGNPLAPEVALEEKKWIELNYPQFCS